MADPISSAGGGAAAGALAGTVVPGVGNVAGAVVGGAVGLASGLFQAYQSAKANGANQAELNKLQDLIAKVKSPNFDSSMITPEDYKVVGTYAPQMQKVVAEANPTLVTGTSAEAQQGADARNAVLQRYAAIAKTGSDEQSAQLQQDAAKSAATQAAGTMGAIQNNMAARGLGGSGSELAMKLSAADNANQTNALASQNIAQNAYQNRLQALAQQGRMGQDIRNEGLNMEGQNAGIVNQWNQRAQVNQQAIANDNVNSANAAQRSNLATAQGIANQNTGAHNTARTNQQTTYNNNQQSAYSDDLARYGKQAGLGQSQMQQNTNVAEANSRVAQGLGDAASVAANAAGKYYDQQPGTEPTDAQQAARKKSGYYTDDNGFDYGA